MTRRPTPADIFVQEGLVAVKSALDAQPFRHTPNFDDLQVGFAALLRYVADHPLSADIPLPPSIVAPSPARRKAS